MTVSYMQKFGRTMVENGFQIVPIEPNSKACRLVNWSQTDSKELIGEWIRTRPHHGVGIQTRFTPAIDVDCMDVGVVKTMVDFIREVIGPGVFFRSGLNPKSLCVVRIESPIKKLFSKKYRDIFGYTHQIEILGEGQQFVALGTHPDTGRPYKWHTTQIEDVEVSALPWVTVDQLKSVIAHFEEIADAREDWSEIENEHSDPAPLLHDLQNLKPPLGLLPEESQRMINVLDPNMHHDKWVKIGMALYHEYSGSDVGFQIWDTWSQIGGTYDPTIMGRKWDSFAADLQTTNPTTMATVKMMYNDAIEKTTAVESVDFVSLAEISKRIGSVKWLVKGWIEENTMSCIFGAPGSYKSFMAIDMACHVATGTPWQGCDVVKGNVLYLAGEGHGGIGRRTMAWCLARDKKPEEVPVFFSNKGVDIFTAESAVHLTASIENLVNQIGDVSLVVVDTLARSMGGGDENSTADMNRFISHTDKFLREKFNCSTLIVHHTGHKEKDRARGSSALLGALDHNIKCEKVSELAARLTATKMKDAPEPDSMYLKGFAQPIGFDEDNELMDSLVFEKGEAPMKKVKPLTELQQQVYDIIKELQNGEDFHVNKVDIYRRVEEKDIYEEGRKARRIVLNLESLGYIRIEAAGVIINQQLSEV